MCLSKPITRPKRTKKRTDTAAPETGQVAKTASEATIVTYLPDVNCRPHDFFRKVRPAVVPISQPDRVLRTEEVPDFWKVVGKNTDYVIAAEECVAENFALALMVFDDSEAMDALPNPEITRKIISALKGRFK